MDDLKYAILAKYGEMALKGLNLCSFENALVRNIQNRIGDGFNVSRKQSTVYITPKTDSEKLGDVYKKLETVFGIATLCTAVICEKNFEDIVQKTAEHFGGILPYKKTFKVSAKRADKRFYMDSPQICRELGHSLLEKFPGLTVDCENPDVEIRVDIRDRNAFVYGEKTSGACGLPVGTGGRALLLLSGGIDSPIAGYMLAKRGVKISALYFETPPYTSERAKMKAEQLAQKMSDYCGNVKLYTKSITEISEKIKKQLPLPVIYRSSKTAND